MKKTLIIAAVSIMVIAGVVFLYSNYRKQEKLMSEITTLQFSDVVLGDANTDHSVIIYFDYNCGFCKKFFKDVYPRFNENYIQTGKARIVLKLVCGLTDKMALRANQTLICINKYGNFDKLHRLLLHESKVMYTNVFSQLIEDYIVVNESLGECILDQEYPDVIRNIYQFQELKCKGTPTFVINDKLVVGFITYEELIEKLNN